jgi:histidine ammonia-lyase
MQPLTISGQGLKVDDVVAVAHGRPVTLDPAALPAIERSQAAVERLVDEGRIAYGITTGFGRFKDKLISPDQARQLQVNLVRSHAVGVGPALDEPYVRAMMLVRVNTLAKGYSGVHPDIIVCIRISPRKDRWAPAAIWPPWRIWPWY